MITETKQNYYYYYYLFLVVPLLRRLIHIEFVNNWTLALESE